MTGYNSIMLVLGIQGSFLQIAIKIKLHKPHPGNLLKQYLIGLIIYELKKEGLI